jgi:hypothetical protein
MRLYESVLLGRQRVAEAKAPPLPPRQILISTYPGPTPHSFSHTTARWEHDPLQPSMSVWLRVSSDCVLTSASRHPRNLPHTNLF